MAGSNQYRDYIKRSFLRFAFSIIALLFVLVGLFLFINVQLISAGGNRKNNARLGAVLDKQVRAYEDGLLRFGSDDRILEALKGRDSGRVTEVNRLLYDFSNAQSIRCSFVLTDSGGEIVSSNLFEGNREIFLNSAVFHSMFEKMAAEPDKIFTMPSRLNYAHGQAGDLALARAVSGPDRVYGYLFFDLSDEQIYAAVRDYPLDDVILTDRYDNLIFSIGRQSADPMEKYPAGKYRMEWQKGNVVKVNGKHYHVQKELLPESTLVLYTLVSMEFQRTLVSYGMIFLLIVGVLMLIMITPLSLRIAGKNLEAIDELQHAVAEMGRGNMDYKLQGQVFDEFKVLGDAFCNMVTQREELMLHNSELTERKRIMEIKQLEEQFNPHFIFNVLETLRYEIAIDTAKASDMVMAFANLMRYSIYYGSTIVPLQTDIEYINDYLLLQKMRYNRRLNYHIDIPEELMGCKIPKLLLQPVVENSLVHGMKNIHSITINISAWKENGQLNLCVEDNGSGISEDKLKELRKGLEQEDVYREHIGLYNSHRVVRLLYGPESGMTIESSPGNGTRVIVTLPADMEET
ncbi:sensor histidine kinase [Enterocloster sp. OA13]|uniref:sensor histidine kinase n=1 Tax=Enterocloster TaxID=2719313 RepID=UPI00047126B4|nr:sensor histidine kinase [Lachnoclostridium pacaense]MCC2876474.1 sensor histidine kinase [Lachnoclostridium pacaense]MCD8170616.1 sensor histidine kinase [Clostridiales bacterium]MCH1948099.1 sensor histidine kinase [Enterocloster sp. OA13]